MDDEWVRLYLRLGRYRSQTGVGLPLLQCWVPLSVCFSFVLAWMGFSVARNEEACPISYHIPCSSWYHHHTVQFFRLQKWNRKVAYCCIRGCSLVLLASSAVYALIRITYLAVRNIHIISSSRIKPEHRVQLYTLMFARAFGIFCCFCLFWYRVSGKFVVCISHHVRSITNIMWLSSWYHHHTVQFFRLQKLNRKLAYCCIRWCSLVLLASSAV